MGESRMFFFPLGPFGHLMGLLEHPVPSEPPVLDNLACTLIGCANCGTYDGGGGARGVWREGRSLCSPILSRLSAAGVAAAERDKHFRVVVVGRNLQEDSPPPHMHASHPQHLQFTTPHPFTDPSLPRKNCGWDCKASPNAYTHLPT